MSKNDKFAIIKLGGAQHLVKEDDTLTVNNLGQEEGSKIEITDVLLVQDGDTTTIGTPLVEGASIKAEIVENTKGKKVVKQTYKAKARTRRKVGHRQQLTKIKINKISVK